ncbi:MAG: DNA-protecting protein DprA [Bdellovibrionales bacterium]|nr:DNA-protecting protein DprA [Bdellovibrionales bacterium]
MMLSEDFIQKTISPKKEMYAYETLWAMEHSIEDIKEKTLKEMFEKYTPLETLETLSDQYKQEKEFFDTKLSFLEIKEKVDKFLKDSFDKGPLSFSIAVNKAIQYPENLKKHCPVGLFYYKGDLGLLETRCLSIVGARKASDEGLSKARELVKELSQKFTIVSGLAKGIDTVAHQSAIENKGLTIGVIGTPINKYYPKENKELQDRIASDFLLISQVPFYKYSKEHFKSHAYHFPRRNMTMASISEATVVVEASDTSGSLTQARECIKQKKKLFIMDHCFNNPKIIWPKIYEKKGAIRVRKVSDILDILDKNYGKSVD